MLAEARGENAVISGQLKHQRVAVAVCAVEGHHAKGVRALCNVRVLEVRAVEKRRLGGARCKVLLVVQPAQEVHGFGGLDIDGGRGANGHNAVWCRSNSNHRGRGVC